MRSSILGAQLQPAELRVTARKLGTIEPETPISCPACGAYFHFDSAFHRPLLGSRFTAASTMPSDLSYWVISAPLKDGDPDIMLDEVRSALGGSTMVGGFEIPELKVGHPP